jgi:hypothetical protein
MSIDAMVLSHAFFAQAATNICSPPANSAAVFWNVCVQIVVPANPAVVVQIVVTQ